MPNLRCRQLRASPLAALLILLVSSGSAVVAARANRAAPYRISYALSMPQPALHLFAVSITVEPTARAEWVELQMPRWSPGRYAVFDFAKNVQEVSARNVCAPGVECESVKLPVTRVDDQTWRVNTHDWPHPFTFSYKVFGDDLSGTFSQLDARHANFNGGSIFMYVVSHKPDPVTLTIDPPDGWRIVNARTTHDGQRVWQFPNYDLLIDTPTEIAPDWTADEFKVDGKTYRVVVHSFGDEGGKRAALVRDVEKIVRAETGMWGVPDFDSYTFLFHFDPTAARGDGMEHLTSTEIITRRALGDASAYEDTLDTAAHEFFHVWNVKRLRPVELGPWDFTRPLNTRSLWIAEGITNYYGHLMQRRAGLWNDARLYQALADEIGRIENAPGSRLMSAEEASLIAPFRDRAVSAQRTNLAQTSISYYDKGETIGLVLDLLVRARTNNRASLDDVMRRMYEEFYLKSPNATYYLRGRGYTGADFARVASEVAGRNMSDFFARHVAGVEPLPYDEALAGVGLRLVKTPAKDASAPDVQGAKFDYRIEELPNAAPAARALRRAWLSSSETTAPARK